MEKQLTGYKALNARIILYQQEMSKQRDDPWENLMYNPEFDT